MDHSYQITHRQNVTLKAGIERNAFTQIPLAGCDKKSFTIRL
jgi:hypothetical protein